MADTPLSDLQRAVLELFFALPESNGFVLAGGAALVASGLTARPTQDVDLFGSDLAAGIAPAGDALEAACVERGWTIERIRDAATFRRLAVRGSHDELLEDLAVDSPPLGTPTLSAVGPTYPPEELADRKLLRCSIAPRPATSSISTRCPSASISIACAILPCNSTAASPRRYSPTCCHLISGSPMRTSWNWAEIRSSCERSSIGGGITLWNASPERRPNLTQDSRSTRLS
jgi:hypothetical protein